MWSKLHFEPLRPEALDLEPIRRNVMSLFPHLRPSLISLMVSVDVKHNERRRRRNYDDDVEFTVLGCRVNIIIGGKL